jgi:signal transduction histidine kinase
MRSPSYELPLWRALTIFRAAAVVFAMLLAASRASHFTWPLGAVAGLALMAVWTAYTAYQYPRTTGPRWPLLWADLAVTAASLFATRLVLPASDIVVTLPMVWIAGPVIAWAICAGRRAGAFAALAIGGCSMAVRGGEDLTGVNETVLLLLAAIAIGHVVRLMVDTEAYVQEIAEERAGARERDRLARGIHDSVLQVLALVQRRGTELGGEAAELGRLAGEQEAALRLLVGTRADAVPKRTGAADLRAPLGLLATAKVTFAAPADPVPLPADAAVEVAAAVSAALANVREHVGPDAPAWLLVEDEGDRVVVTVRDDGPGIPPGRLDEAAGAGRIGVAKSIRGRIEDLGGTVQIASVAGQGTEVEIRIPR